MLILSVYTGLTNSKGYDYWIKHVLLLYYNPYPAPKSVIVIDNASFHHLVYIGSLFKQASMKLVYLPAYLPAYLPDLNPIKEFFGELKEFI